MGAGNAEKTRSSNPEGGGKTNGGGDTAGGGAPTIELWNFMVR